MGNISYLMRWKSLVKYYYCRNMTGRMQKVSTGEGRMQTMPTMMGHTTNKSVNTDNGGVYARV